MPLPTKLAPRKLIPWALLVLLFAGLLWWLTHRSTAPANILAVTGRLESDDSSISAKVGGRVSQIMVREGDHVKKGDTLAVLDDAQVQARESQAEFGLRQAQYLVLVSRRQVGIAREALEQSRLAVSQSRLDTSGRYQQAREQVAQALATAQQSRTKAVAAGAQIRVLQAQLLQNRLGVPQSQLDSRGRVVQADEQVSAARAELSKAEATAGQAHRDAIRYTNMLAQGAVARQLYEQQVTNDRNQQDTVRAARKQLDAAQGAVMVARSSLFNPNLKTSQVEGVRQQIQAARADLAGSLAAVGQAEASVEAARGNLTATRSVLTAPAVRRSQRQAASEQLSVATAQLKAAQASEGQAQARFQEARDDRADLRVLAPFEGVVATRVAEPGEVVTPGSTLVTLLDLRLVYLRAFVPEGQIGRIKVGQAARVYLDSAPRTPIDAYVSRIDPELSFTPENTYFKDDRVKQVVGIKLQLRGAEGFAKPGMPGDGDVLASGQWRNWR